MNQTSPTRNLLIVALVAAVLAGPSVALLAVAAVLNPAAHSWCLGLTSTVVSEVPDRLTATTADGDHVTLNRAQLTHARTVIVVGSRTAGVDHDGVVTALMAALTESRLRMLSNTSAYPESANYPNDGDGFDHDSLGLFQMRPHSGWGTVAELMDPTYQARAFYGGPAGPNHGSPRGLLDLPDRHLLTLGEAAQAVEVSAHPDRYANHEPVARTILTALTTPGGPAALGVTVETATVVMPLPAGSYQVTSPFGLRADPLDPGGQRMHHGVDFAAPDGTAILAVAAGVVTHAGPSAGGGNRIVIAHLVAGQPVGSVYRHMWDHGIHVTAGDHVHAGHHIGDVGSQGRSTGPHLHLEIRPGGWPNPAVDPQPWLAGHDAGLLGTPSSGGPPCPSAATGPGAAHPLTATPARSS